MKKINTLYWIFTGLFGGFMMFTAIPDIMVVPDAVEFVSNKLGYPEYIIVFLGVAKALGSIAIVVAGFPRIKEWLVPDYFLISLAPRIRTFVLTDFNRAWLSCYYHSPSARYRMYITTSDWRLRCKYVTYFNSLLSEGLILFSNL